MGEAYLDWQKKSGGIKLNDVIEEYKYVAAGKQIKAGDLVNYINGIASKTDYGTSSDTQLSTQIASAYEAKAIQLDENRVFIAHQYNNSTQNVAGIVCTISGANITYGTDTQLNDIGNNKCYLPSKLLLLENGNVFIPYTTSNGYRVYGMLVSIDGSVITVKADTNLNNNAGSSSLSAELLPNGNIFIAHAYNTNYHLYGMIVNVSGATLTVATDTAISTTQNSGEVISTELLANGNVFIAHSNAYYKTLTAMVVSISGTTITAGTNVQLSSVNYSGLVISTCLLQNGNVFVAHNYDDTNHYLYGVACSINGTTITAGTDTAISTDKYSGYRISVEPLPNNKAFILHSSSLTSNYTLYGIIINNDGIAITLGQDTPMNVTQSSGYSLSSLLLKNGTLFIIHGQTQSQYMLYAQIWGIDYENNIPTNNIVITEYEQQVTPAIEPPFNAVALSSGVGGTDTEHNEQVKIARVPMKLSMLPVGSLVKDTSSTFLGEPVIWKIADKNHEGYPDGSVTLVTERSIALRAFDAKEPNNSDADRQSYGNNRYSVSNIRQWLNSDAEAGQWYSAQHSADQSPTTDYVSVNAYSDDSGFLNGFSDNFKNALLETTLTVVLNTVTDGGGSENVTDKIFLASTTEVGLANENSIAEGSLLSIFSDDASRIAYVTSKAIEDSKYASDPANDTTAFGWLLRTPVASLTVNAHFANETGALRGVAAYYGFRGVRPLCNIPSSTMVSDKPDEDGCYTLFAGGEA